MGLQQNIENSFVLLEKFLPRYFTGAVEFYQRINHQDSISKTQKMSSFEEFKELLRNVGMKTLSNPVITSEYELYQFIVQRYHSQMLFLGRRFSE